MYHRQYRRTSNVKTKTQTCPYGAYNIRRWRWPFSKQCREDWRWKSWTAFLRCECFAPSSFSLARYLFSNHKLLILIQDHFNPLLVYNTYSQGEEIHCSAWPPVAPHPGGPAPYSMADEGELDSFFSFLYFADHNSCCIFFKCIFHAGTMLYYPFHRRNLTAIN